MKSELIRSDSALRRTLSGLMLALALALSGPVLAQGDGANAARVQELRQLQQSLTELRQQAMADNPELEQRQQAFQDRVMSRMRDEGVEPRKAIRRLQDISRKLQSGEVGETERNELMQEYQQTRTEVMQARRVAMGDEAIIEAEQALRTALIEAMAEQDAEAPAMIERFETLRREVGRNRGGGPNAGAGRGGSGQGSGQ